MLKKFSTKELVLIALFAALMGVIGNSTSAITSALGIPFISVFNVLFVAVLAGFLALLIKKFGTLTLMYLIIGVLYWPGPALGPPGLYKIAVLFFPGLITDIILTIGNKKRRQVLPIAIAVGILLIPLEIYVFASLLSIPGIEKTLFILDKLAIGGFIFGLIGGWLGTKIYKRLKNKRIFKI